MAAQQKTKIESFGDAVIEAPTATVSNSDAEPISLESAEKIKSERFIAESSSSKVLDATQMYLNEIGFSPLLSPEEEVHFARLARKGDEKGPNA